MPWGPSWGGGREMAISPPAWHSGVTPPTRAYFTHEVAGKGTEQEVSRWGCDSGYDYSHHRRFFPPLASSSALKIADKDGSLWRGIGSFNNGCNHSHHQSALPLLLKGQTLRAHQSEHPPLLKVAVFQKLF